ncbi:hemerythrin domain-containing protein [bacterium]|nr:MAG: hemerythrin domain-containing protein [bacterium]
MCCSTADVPPIELKRQHQTLRARVSRLREALAAPGDQRAALASAVGELLPELFQHESGEAARLGPLLEGRPASLRVRVEGEHLTLRSLARDLQLVLQNPNLYPYEHLARLSRGLADGLSAHIDFEEGAVLPPAV